MGIGTGCVTASARRGGKGGGGWNVTRYAYVKTLYETRVCDLIEVKIEKLRGKKYVSTVFAPKILDKQAYQLLVILLKKGGLLGDLQTKVMRAIVVEELERQGIEPTSRHYEDKPLSYILYVLKRQEDIKDKKVQEVVRWFFTEGAK